MSREFSFLDEISFKARVFELSHFPVSVKSPAGIIRRVPKIVPYDPDARDADNDGLVQEGTIWERPSGALFRGLQRGARALAGAVDLVDGSGNKIDYKPGDSENSPLRGGRVERRIRGRGQRRLNRAERRRQRAQRDRNRAPEQREELDALDQQIARLENAVAEDSRERLLAAEAAREEFDQNMNSFLDGFIEGWSGIKKGPRSQRGDKVQLDAEKLEGERRQVGDANDREPLKDHEDLFDDEILPEEIDRDEHRRKLDEDPDYRREWNRRLAEEGEHRRADGTVVPPRDEQIPRDAPEADAPEARDIQELRDEILDTPVGELVNSYPEETAVLRSTLSAVDDPLTLLDVPLRDLPDENLPVQLDEAGRLRGDGTSFDEENINEILDAIVPENVPETPESQGGGAPDPDADIPEDDASLSPRERLVAIYRQDMERIEGDLARGGEDSDSDAEQAEQIDRNIDFIDSFVEEVDSSLDAGAISEEERDNWVGRATRVRDRLDAERIAIRRDIEDRDSQIDADMDAEEDRGRIVEGSFSNLKQRMEDEGIRRGESLDGTARRRFLRGLSDTEVEDAFRDSVAQGDARTEVRRRLRRDEVSVESRAVADEYAKRLFNKFADDHADSYFDEGGPDFNPDNWEPLEELRETLAEAEWTHLEDALNNWGNGNTGEEGLSRVYWDQVDGDPENLAMWSPFIEEFEAEVSNANPYNPFEFRPPEVRGDQFYDNESWIEGDFAFDNEAFTFSIAEAIRNGDDQTLQGTARSLRRYRDELSVTELNGDKGRRLDELEDIFRTEGGNRAEELLDPDLPDSDSPEADLAVQQQENLINEWNNLLDDPDDALLFRSVDELGQIARGEFPVGDIDPVTAEQRASFQRLARRQIEQRNVERELPSGETIFDVADMDDDQLDTRIAGLVAADPVGDNALISAQLNALKLERQRRMRGDFEAEAVESIVKDLDNDELDEIIAGGDTPLSEMLGESARISAEIEKRDRSNETPALPELNEAEAFVPVDQELAAWGDGVNEGMGDHPAALEMLQLIPPDQRSDFEDALYSNDQRGLEGIINSFEAEANRLPILPGDPDPNDAIREFRRFIDAQRARRDRERDLKGLVEDPHGRVRETQAKLYKAQRIVDQVVNGRVSDEELDIAINALSDFQNPRAVVNRGDAIKNHNFLHSYRQNLIALREIRKGDIDANPDVRDVLDVEWVDADGKSAIDQTLIRDVVDRLDLKIQGLRDKRRNWKKELRERRKQNVDVVDPNVESFDLEDVEEFEKAIGVRYALHQKYLDIKDRPKFELAKESLKRNRQSLYDGTRGRRQDQGDLAQLGIWRGELFETGESLDAIGGVDQKDYNGLNDADLVRAIEEQLLPNVRKKIKRENNGRAHYRNDGRDLGVPGIDGHIANVDRALEEVNRRWDAAPAGGEVRDQIGGVRRKLKNLKSGRGHNLEIEREFRVQTEVQRIANVREKDGNARDAVQNRKDLNNSLENILAVNGLAELDADAITSILEDPDNENAPRLFLELKNWRSGAYDIGRTDGVNPSDFFDENDNWNPMTSLPEGVGEANSSFRSNVDIVDGVISDHSSRMRGRVFDDFEDRRNVDLANLQDMVDRNPDLDGEEGEDFHSLMELVKDEFDNLDAPDTNDSASFNNRYNAFKQTLAGLQDVGHERLERKEVDDHIQLAEDLLSPNPQAFEGLSIEERKALVLDALGNNTFMQVASFRGRGVNQYVSEIVGYNDRLRDLWKGFDVEVYRERRAANGIEELPDRPNRKGMDVAVVSDFQSGLADYDSDGRAVIKQVPIGNKGMNTQGDADTYLANGGHLKDVPTEYLIKAIRSNTTNMNQDGDIDPTKRFSAYKIGDGGVNTPGGLNAVIDKATGAELGLKYENLRTRDGAYGYREDVSEVMSARIAEDLGLLQGAVVRGGALSGNNDAKRANPLVFELAGSVVHDGSFEKPDGLRRNGDVGDLVRGTVLDAILHHTDRHEKNYFQYTDRNGNLRLYVIDNGLIDANRNNDMNSAAVLSVKKYLKNGQNSGNSGWINRLKDVDNSEIQPHLQDVLTRLDAMDIDALQNELLNMMPEVDADRVDIEWLKKRIEDIKRLGLQGILELWR
ncbi:MAG: hypothetical protein CMQ41_15530 [Gammaproteobacteria bacterium]|nr:hypothetical protein [Gammaproteobacteria bacterium]